MKKVSFGTVSQGTLRDEDLIESFRNELHYYHVRCPKLPTKAEMESFSSEYVEELIELLNSFAPTFCYFGAIEGDGADFGFWPDHERIREAIYDGEIVQIDAGTEIPEINGYILEVTDHGNATLFYRSRNGHVKELWSVV